jgi:hypothetical protein
MSEHDVPTTTDLAHPNGNDPSDAPADAADRSAEALLPEDLSEGFRDRWQAIQVRFVDEPRASVQDADGLVSELMQQVAGAFTEQRSRLEEEWKAGGEVSTEDLRRALQRYRSFFSRLLAA